MQLVCFKIVSGQYFLFVEGIQIPVPIPAVLCGFINWFRSNSTLFLM